MAVALAEVAEMAASEGAEGEAAGGESGLTQDSASSAQSGGADIAKMISGAISLGSAILGLVTAIRTGRDQKADIKERRYAAGLLNPEEVREDLIRNTTLAPYWSEYNIKSLLKKGKTPYGWTPATTVGQGFGPEVAAWYLRQRHTDLAARRDAFAKRELQSLQIKNVADTTAAKAKNLEVIRLMRDSLLN